MYLNSLIISLGKATSETRTDTTTHEVCTFELQELKKGNMLFNDLYLVCFAAIYGSHMTFLKREQQVLAINNILSCPNIIIES